MGRGASFIQQHIQRQVNERDYQRALKREKDTKADFLQALGQQGHDAYTPSAGITPGGMSVSQPASEVMAGFQPDQNNPMSQVPTAEAQGMMTPLWQDDMASTGMASSDPLEQQMALAKMSMASPEMTRSFTQSMADLGFQGSGTGKESGDIGLEDYQWVTVGDDTTPKRYSTNSAGVSGITGGRGFVPLGDDAVVKPYSVKKDGSRKITTALRKEFNREAKPFRDINQAYTRVKESRKKPTAAGDLSLIFNYMKMLDPGSVVRESEFATAAASGSLGDRFIAAGNKLLAGERLADDMRQDFSNRADMLYSGASGDFGRNVYDRYKGLADSGEIDSGEVVHDYRSSVTERKRGSDPSVNFFTGGEDELPDGYTTVDGKVFDEDGNEMEWEEY